MDNKVTTVPMASGSLWKPKERTEALEAARRKPIPDRKEEDWRYLNPNAFPWEKVEAACTGDARYEAAMSSELVKDTTVPTIDLERDAEKLGGLFAVRDEDIDAKFLYLHCALAGPVAAYRIPADYRGAPIRIIQRINGSKPATFTTVLYVETGADAVVYDRWESEANGSLPAIGRVEIVLEPGARLHFLHEDLLSQGTHLYRRVRAQVAESARLDWGVFTTGSVWHAARMEVELQGPGSESAAYGLFCGAGERTAEHRTIQNHPHPRAKSNSLFKSLLAGKARSVYQGMIRVEKAAQRTDAYQASRNLTLSPTAHAEAIPRLEILADDVRCSHGATVGAVDEDALFYLMTRGLNRQQAVATVATGFAEEVIRRVPLEDVAQRWRQIVRRTIEDNLI